MNSCHEFEEAMWEAAENEVVQPAFASHLAGCQKCQESLRRLQEALPGFAALRAVNAPDPRAAIQEKLLHLTRSMRFFPALSAAGSFVVIVLLIALFYYRLHDMLHSPQVHHPQMLQRLSEPPAPVAAPVVSPRPERVAVVAAPPKQYAYQWSETAKERTTVRKHRLNRQALNRTISQQQTASIATTPVRNEPALVPAPEALPAEAAVTPEIAQPCVQVTVLLPAEERSELPKSLPVANPTYCVLPQTNILMLDTNQHYEQ